MEQTFLISELPSITVDENNLMDVLMLENDTETGKATVFQMFQACVAYYMSNPAFGADITRAVNAYIDEHGIGELTAKAAALAARPIGSWYWSDDPTEPSVLFGGVWERMHGRVLYAEDENHPVGSEGGSETVQLTIEEMPSHTHKVRYVGGKAGGVYGGQPGTSADASPAYNQLLVAKEGGDQPHENMMPWHASYLWRRTA